MEIIAAVAAGRSAGGRSGGRSTIGPLPRRMVSAWPVSTPCRWTCPPSASRPALMLRWWSAARSPAAGVTATSIFLVRH